jgi:TolB protein
VDAGTEGEPAWTPDGSRIVYTSSPKGVVPQLVSVRLDGSDPRPLTTSPGGNRAPVVSPDGKRVAFVSLRDGNPEIYDMAADGTDLRRLTKSSDREGNPRYLPNGDLLFTVEKGGGARLMRLPAAGATPQPVLQIDQPVIGLDVSRDGERIAYVAGKLGDGRKSQLSLRVQALAGGGPPMLIPLRPGERVQSPSF